MVFSTDKIRRDRQYVDVSQHEAIDRLLAYRDEMKRRHDILYPKVCVLRQTDKAVWFGRANSLATCWLPRSAFHFLADVAERGERPDRPDGRALRFMQWSISVSPWGRSKLEAAGVIDRN